MITVHHLNNSRSQRILWLLEELGLNYTIKLYARDPKTMLAPAALKAVHPLGKSPVITDNDLTLAESGAIIQYLAHQYAQKQLAPPPDSPDRLRYLYWLHYAEGSAMPPLLLSLVFSQLPKRPMPFFIRPIVRNICKKAHTTFINPQLALHLSYMDSELEKHPWFAGEYFTAADIQMSFPLEAAASRGALTKNKQPHLHAFLEKIHARVAYQKALEKGGHYDLLK